MSVRTRIGRVPSGCEDTTTSRGRRLERAEFVQEPLLIAMVAVFRSRGWI